MTNLTETRFESFNKEDNSRAAIIFFGNDKSENMVNDLIKRWLSLGGPELHVVDATIEIKKEIQQVNAGSEVHFHETYDDAYNALFPNDDKWLLKAITYESLESFINKEKIFNKNLAHLVESLRRHSLSKKTHKLIDGLDGALIDQSIDFRKGYVFCISRIPEIIELREVIETVDLAFDEILEVNYNLLKI
ncbi:hypothetical protein [Acinetobacter calcoaceticus]